MPSRECVAAGLRELRTWWPSMPDTPQLLESTLEGVEGFDDAEYTAAVKRLTREHRAGWPPKLADLRAMCGAVASIRRADTIAARRHDASDAYCPTCGTLTLTWSAVWPNGRSRMVPLHEAGCPRSGAEDRPSAPVNMGAWPGKPAQRTT